MLSNQMSLKLLIPALFICCYNWFCFCFWFCISFFTGRTIACQNSLEFIQKLFQHQEQTEPGSNLIWESLFIEPRLHHWDWGRLHTWNLCFDQTERSVRLLPTKQILSAYRSKYQQYRFQCDDMDTLVSVSSERWPGCLCLWECCSSAQSRHTSFLLPLLVSGCCSVTWGPLPIVSTEEAHFIPPPLSCVLQEWQRCGVMWHHFQVANERLPRLSFLSDSFVHFVYLKLFVLFGYSMESEEKLFL